jgi:hypothetical protein
LQAFDVKQRNGQNHGQREALQERGSKFRPGGPVFRMRGRLQQAVSKHDFLLHPRRQDDEEIDTAARNSDSAKMGNKKPPGSGGLEKLGT